MGNTKLDPRSLTSEDRALWDALAITARRNGRVAAECYSATEGAFRDLLKVRRAIFGGGKVECPNCGGEMLGHDEHREFVPDPVAGGNRFMAGPFWCERKPAQPEPVADWRDKTDESVAFDLLTQPSDALKHISNTPVGPEPVAAEITAMIEAEERFLGLSPSGIEVVQPVAAEMPEAVHEAANYLRQESRYESDPQTNRRTVHQKQIRSRVLSDAADALETFWRTHAKPAPAVAMTPELERALEAARARAWDCHASGNISRCEDIRADIAAVRSQAAEAGIKLPKVREFLEWANRMEFTADGEILLMDAIAELDAAEGRKP